MSKRYHVSPNIMIPREYLSLFLVFLFVAVYFRLSGILLGIMLLCCVAIIVLKANWALCVIATLYFLVPSDYTPFLYIHTPFGSFPFYVVLIPVLIVAYLVSTTKKTKKIKTTEFFIYISLFSLFILQIFDFLAFDSNIILANVIQGLLQTAGILLITKLQKLDEEQITRTYTYFCFLIIFSVVIAVGEMFFGLDLYKTVYKQDSFSEDYLWAMSNNLYWRTKSTFGNAMVFGSTMVMCFPIVEYMRRRQKGKVFSLIMMAFLATGVVLSGNRSAIILLLLYILYIIIKSELKWKLPTIMLVLATAIFLYFRIDISIITGRFETLFQSASFTHRAESYKLFADVYMKYPINGVGLGNTYSVLDSYVSSTSSFVVNTFDNAFMDYTLAIGILGWAAFAVALHFISKTIREKQNHMAPGTVIVFVALSFILNTTRYQSIWGLLWMYIAINMYTISDTPVSRKD